MCECINLIITLHVCVSARVHDYVRALEYA